MFANGRQPQFFLNRKTSSISSQTEDNLNFSENGRLIQSLANGRLIQSLANRSGPQYYSKLKTTYFFLENGRQPQLFEKL